MNPKINVCLTIGQVSVLNDKQIFPEIVEAMT